MNAGELEVEVLELRSRLRRWRLLAVGAFALLLLGALLSTVVIFSALSWGSAGPIRPNARRAMIEEQRALAAQHEAMLAAETARLEAQVALQTAKASAEQADSNSADEVQSPSEQRTDERNQPASE